MSGGETDEQRESAETERAARGVVTPADVADLPFAWRRVGRAAGTLLGLAVAVVTVVAISVGFGVSALGIGIAIGSVFVLCFAGLAGLDWQATQRLRRSLAARGDMPWDEALGATLLPYLARHDWSAACPRALRAAAVHVATHAGAGQVVRIAASERARAPLGAPLAESLEPVLLDWHNKVLPDAPDGDLGDRLRHGLLPREIDPGGGTANRVAMFIVWGLCGLSAVQFLVRLLTGGLRLSRGEQVFFGAMVLLGIAQFIIRRRREEWYAVPGALIVRDANWWSSSWSVHLFPRTESTLIYWADRKALVVGNQRGESFVRKEMQPYEITFALRAFRSELPPPSLEQLSDLK